MKRIIRINSHPGNGATVIVAKGYTSPVVKKSHAADHIPNEDIIAEISEFFIGNGKLRNNLLFLLGCNCGLRCGEIISLKWGQLIDPDGTIKSKAVFIEEKNSQKDKVDEETGNIIKGKVKTREVVINDTVKEAIDIFMRSKEMIALDDFVFKSESRSANYYSQRRKNGIGARADHMTRQAVDQMLKKTIKETLGYIDFHVSTHTMRKTFARCVWDRAPESQRNDVARFLQKMLGHASLDSTLHYIGVTQQEMDDTYMNLNLGKRKKTAKVVALKIPVE